MPWVASRPLILLTCCTRSAISRCRSQWVRRASSRSTEGTCTMLQTARSPTPRHQGPQQHRRIEPIGLGPPGSSINLQAAGVHHPAGDPLGRKAALQPEPVIAGLIAEDDLYIMAAFPLLARLQAAEQGEEAGDVTAVEPVRRGFAARRSSSRKQPARLAEFHGYEHDGTIPSGFGLFNVTHRPTP